MTAFHITHILPVEERAGVGVFSGAENHLFTLMRAQAQAGHVVELVMLIYHDGPRLQQQRAALHAEGIEVISLFAVPFTRRPPFYRRGETLSFLPALMRVCAARREHIIHTHLDAADLVGALAAWLVGCRRVITSIHNNEPHYTRLLWKLRFHGLNLCVRRRIAISQAVQEELVQGIGLKAERVHCIPYGIALPESVLTQTAARQALGLPVDGFMVGFVGRLTAQKDLPTLLRALQHVPDIQAVLIGEGEERPSLEAFAHQLRLTSVRFVGHVADAAQFMPAFDVLCLPSRWEGLGLVLLEAMARNVPVIGSAAGAIPQVLDNGTRGWLFPVGDEAALLEALQAVRSGGAPVAQRVAQARCAVTQEYTISKMLEKTLQVYRQL